MPPDADARLGVIYPGRVQLGTNNFIEKNTLGFIEICSIFEN